MMMGCDTLLTVGSSLPYTQFMPAFGQARAVQIDLDASLIGMRYPDAPHLHVHVAAATPTFQHVEWFQDHVRIEHMLFDGTLDPTGGVIRPDPRAPAHGLALREGIVERFRKETW